MWARNCISVKLAKTRDDDILCWLYTGSGRTLSDPAETVSCRGNDTSSGIKPVSKILSHHFPLFELAEFILDQHFHHVSGNISDGVLTALKQDLLSCGTTNLLFELTLVKRQGATGWWLLSGFRMFLP